MPPRTKSEPFTQSYTGRLISLVHPEPADFCIEDIAHSLSQICRFSGGTKTFYSVAQHSVLVAQESKVCSRTSLMHDAAEAYLSDLPTHIKMLCKEYQEIEYKFMMAISKRFHLVYPLPSEVVRADRALLMAERRDLRIDQGLDFGIIEDPVPYTIIPWSSHKAKHLFLYYFMEYK